MTDTAANTACPPDILADVVEAVRADDERGLSRLDELIGDYPLDAQLQFLRGSVLAGVKRYDEAREAMARAVEIAPLYTVARFQLGLLELSSGDGPAADATLEPLEQLGGANALAIFARGLRLLMRDEMEPALLALREGISRNTENPAINRDMGLIVADLEAKLGAAATAPSAGVDEPTTSTHMLLQQLAAKGPKH